jgi:DDE superfamily endonuclease
LSHCLDQLIEPLRETLSASQVERVRSHVYGQLLCLGRHTITGLLSTAGRIHCDWSADYRLYSNARIEPEAVFGCVLRAIDQQLSARRPMVLALDDSILRKRGPRAHGVRWCRDPLGPPFALNFVRAQRVVQISAAVPTARLQARMVPVDFQHAPMPHKPKATAGAQEQAAYAAEKKRCNINTVAVQRLSQLRAQLSRALVTVCDGRFANRTFLKAALPVTGTIITRIRKDSVLYLPVQQQPTTGRRRLYGEQAPTPEELRVDESTPWQYVRGFAANRIHRFKIKSLPQVLTPLSGAQPCQLIVIAPLGYRLRANSPLLYRQPAFLLCTDTAVSLRKVLQYYLWRWDIEVNFRDEKTLLGVGQAQVRRPESCQRVPAVAVAAYALLLLAAHRAYPPSARENCELFPPPRWRTRKTPRLSTSSLLDRLRFELFAHALRPGSFTGFWSAAPPDQNRSKLPCSLASSLFHMRN